MKAEKLNTIEGNRYMKFAEAYEAYKQGKKIRRASWDDGVFFYDENHDKSKINTLEGRCAVKIEDAVADYWHIVNCLSHKNKPVCMKCNRTGFIKINIIKIEKHYHPECEECITIPPIDQIMESDGWVTRQCHCIVDDEKEQK